MLRRLQRSDSVEEMSCLQRERAALLAYVVRNAARHGEARSRSSPKRSLSMLAPLAATGLHSQLCPQAILPSVNDSVGLDAVTLRELSVSSVLAVSNLPADGRLEEQTTALGGEPCIACLRLSESVGRGAVGAYVADCAVGRRCRQTSRRSTCAMISPASSGVAMGLACWHRISRTRPIRASCAALLYQP